MSGEWQSDVYQGAMGPGFPPDWKAVKKEILRRDLFTCQRCGSRKHLSVHHIIPRAEGGDHNRENLVVLCIPCHDFVESEGYRSMWQILHMGMDDEAINGKPEAETDEWPTWVYGGYSRPRTKKR